MTSKSSTVGVVAARLLSSREWRLLAAAMLLHVILAFTLTIVGRAEIAPAIVDRDGIVSAFAFDSYKYQSQASQLAATLRQGGFRAWASGDEPIHVKLIAIPFTLLGPILGYGPLSAEPFNLLCYAAVLALVMVLGREISGERVGLVAAGVVALWPTFVLHTLQLLKDVLFIAAALMIILLVTTWLTRTYRWRSALVIGIAIPVAMLALLTIRLQVGMVVMAVVGFGAVLLAVRQVVERRLMYSNMTCALPAFLTAVLLVLFSSSSTATIKRNLSPEVGQSKTVAASGIPLTTTVLYRPHNKPNSDRASLSRVRHKVDDLSLRIGGYRSRYTASYSETGSLIDRHIEFRDLSGLVSYLPRAAQIGLWAPFPNTWFSSTRRVGRVGMLLSAVETLVIYLCQMLALVGIARTPRRIALWFLLLVPVIGVTALALVVNNVGALYRFRYAFWILLIVLAANGLLKVLTVKQPTRTEQEQTPRRLGVMGRAGTLAIDWKALAWSAAICVAVVVVLAAVSVSSSRYFARPSDQLSPLHNNTATQVDSNGQPTTGLIFRNYSGTQLRGFYLSRSDSTDWEENLLGPSGLADGATLKIKFEIPPDSAKWDLRIEAAKSHSEWKQLELVGERQITLTVTAESLAVVEIE